MTPQEAGLLVRSLLSAGFDTTVHGLGAAMRCLALNPDQFAALRAEPSKARAAFEEAIRLETPVHDDPHALDGERRLCDRGRDHDLAPSNGRGRDGEILRMGVQRSVERRDVDAGPGLRA